jgi:hypothetical protein
MATTSDKFRPAQLLRRFFMMLRFCAQGTTLCIAGAELCPGTIPSLGEGRLQLGAIGLPFCPFSLHCSSHGGRFCIWKLLPCHCFFAP